MTKDELQAALDLCVEALEEVEWQEDDLVRWCPWCLASLHHYAAGRPVHLADCLRQRALAAALMQ